jgi:hypothetical protein
MSTTTTQQPALAAQLRSLATRLAVPGATLDLPGYNGLIRLADDVHRLERTFSELAANAAEEDDLQASRRRRPRRAATISVARVLILNSQGHGLSWESARTVITGGAA